MIHDIEKTKDLSDTTAAKLDEAIIKFSRLNGIPPEAGKDAFLKTTPS